MGGTEKNAAEHAMIRLTRKPKSWPQVNYGRKQKEDDAFQLVASSSFYVCLCKARLNVAVGLKARLAIPIHPNAGNPVVFSNLSQLWHA